MPAVANARNFDYSALDQSEVLYCRVSLARNWKAELEETVRKYERILPLSHKRDARTPRRTVNLAPGKSVQLPLELAEGFFGRFSIPILNLAATAPTEAKKNRYAEEYALTRAQVILRWGDSPRLARAGAGMTYEPLGPARFPDVTVAIIPAEEDDETKHDQRYKPVRLRELYDLGEYWDAEHLVNPGGFNSHRVREDEKQAQADFEASKNRMASMEGQIATLTALIASNPDLVAKLNQLSAQAPAKK